MDQQSSNISADSHHSSHDRHSSVVSRYSDVLRSLDVENFCLKLRGLKRRLSSHKENLEINVQLCVKAGLDENAQLKKALKRAIFKATVECIRNGKKVKDVSCPATYLDEFVQQGSAAKDIPAQSKSKQLQLLQELQGKIQELSSHLTCAESQRGSIEIDTYQCQQKLKAEQISPEELMNSFEQNEKKVKELKHHLKAAKKCKSDLEIQAQQLDLYLADLESQKNHFESMYNQCNETLISKQISHENLKECLAEREKLVEFSSAQNAIYLSDLKSFDELCEKLKAELSETKDKLEKMVARCRQNSIFVDDILQETAESDNKMDIASKTLKKSRKTSSYCQTDADATEELCKDLKNQLQESEKKLEVMQKKYNDLEATMAIEREIIHTKAAKELELKLSEANQEKQELMSTYNQCANELSSCKSQCSELNEKLKSVLEDLEVSKNKYHQLEAAVQEIMQSEVGLDLIEDMSVTEGGTQQNMQPLDSHLRTTDIPSGGSSVDDNLVSRSSWAETSTVEELVRFLENLGNYVAEIQLKEKDRHLMELSKQLMNVDSSTQTDDDYDNLVEENQENKKKLKEMEIISVLVEKYKVKIQEELEETKHQLKMERAKHSADKKQVHSSTQTHDADLSPESIMYSDQQYLWTGEEYEEKVEELEDTKRELEETKRLLEETKAASMLIERYKVKIQDELEEKKHQQEVEHDNRIPSDESDVESHPYHFQPDESRGQELDEVKKKPEEMKEASKASSKLAGMKVTESETSSQEFQPDERYESVVRELEELKKKLKEMERASAYTEKYKLKLLEELEDAKDKLEKLEGNEQKEDAFVRDAEFMQMKEQHEEVLCELEEAKQRLKQMQIVSILAEKYKVKLQEELKEMKRQLEEERASAHKKDALAEIDSVQKAVWDICMEADILQLNEQYERALCELEETKQRLREEKTTSAAAENYKQKILEELEKTKQRLRIEHEETLQRVATQKNDAYAQTDMAHFAAATTVASHVSAELEEKYEKAVQELSEIKQKLKEREAASVFAENSRRKLQKELEKTKDLLEMECAKATIQHIYEQIKKDASAQTDEEPFKEAVDTSPSYSELMKVKEQYDEVVCDLKETKLKLEKLETSSELVEENKNKILEELEIMKHHLELERAEAVQLKSALGKDASVQTEVVAEAADALHMNTQLKEQYENVVQELIETKRKLKEMEVASVFIENSKLKLQKELEETKCLLESEHTKTIQLVTTEEKKDSSAQTDGTVMIEEVDESHSCAELVLVKEQHAEAVDKLEETEKKLKEMEIVSMLAENYKRKLLEELEKTKQLLEVGHVDLHKVETCLPSDTAVIQKTVHELCLETEVSQLNEQYERAICELEDTKQKLEKVETASGIAEQFKMKVLKELQETKHRLEVEHSKAVKHSASQTEETSSYFDAEQIQKAVQELCLEAEVSQLNEQYKRAVSELEETEQNLKKEKTASAFAEQFKVKILKELQETKQRLEVEHTKAVKRASAQQKDAAVQIGDKLFGEAIDAALGRAELIKVKGQYEEAVCELEKTRQKLIELETASTFNEQYKIKILKELEQVKHQLEAKETKNVQHNAVQTEYAFTYSDAELVQKAVEELSERTQMVQMNEENEKVKLELKETKMKLEGMEFALSSAQEAYEAEVEDKDVLGEKPHLPEVDADIIRHKTIMREDASIQTDDELANKAMENLKAELQEARVKLQDIVAKKTSDAVLNKSSQTDTDPMEHMKSKPFVPTTLDKICQTDMEESIPKPIVSVLDVARKSGHLDLKSSAASYEKVEDIVSETLEASFCIVDSFVHEMQEKSCQTDTESFFSYNEKPSVATVTCDSYSQTSMESLEETRAKQLFVHEMHERSSQTDAKSIEEKSCQVDIERETSSKSCQTIIYEEIEKKSQDVMDKETKEACCQTDLDLSLQSYKKPEATSDASCQTTMREEIWEKSHQAYANTVEKECQTDAYQETEEKSCQTEKELLLQPYKKREDISDKSCQTDATKETKEMSCQTEKESMPQPSEKLKEISDMSCQTDITVETSEKLCQTDLNEETDVKSRQIEAYKRTEKSCQTDMAEGKEEKICQTDTESLPSLHKKIQETTDVSCQTDANEGAEEKSCQTDFGNDLEDKSCQTCEHEGALEKYSQTEGDGEVKDATEMSCQTDAELWPPSYMELQETGEKFRPKDVAEKFCQTDVHEQTIETSCQTEVGLKTEEKPCQTSYDEETEAKLCQTDSLLLLQSYKKLEDTADASCQTDLNYGIDEKSHQTGVHKEGKAKLCQTDDELLLLSYKKQENTADMSCQTDVDKQDATSQTTIEVATELVQTDLEPIVAPQKNIEADLVEAKHQLKEMKMKCKECDFCSGSAKVLNKDQSKATEDKEVSALIETCDAVMQTDQADSVAFMAETIEELTNRLAEMEERELDFISKQDICKKYLESCDSVCGDLKKNLFEHHCAPTSAEQKITLSDISLKVDELEDIHFLIKSNLLGTQSSAEHLPDAEVQIHASCQKEREKLESLCNELRAGMKKSELQYNKLGKDHALLQQELEKCRKKNDDQNRALREMNESLKSVCKERELLESIINDHKTKMEDLSEEYVTYKLLKDIEIDVLCWLQEEGSKGYVDANNQAAKLLTQCRSGLKQSEAYCEKLKTEISALKRQVAECKSRCSKQETELSSSLERENVIAKEKKCLENTVNEQLHKIEELTEKCSAYALQEKYFSRKSRERAEKSTETTFKEAVVIENHEHCQLKLDESEKNGCKLMKDLERSEQECSALKTDLEKANAESGELISRLSALKKELEVTQAKCIKLGEQLKTAKEARDLAVKDKELVQEALDRQQVQTKNLSLEYNAYKRLSDIETKVLTSSFPSIISDRSTDQSAEEQTTTQEEIHKQCRLSLEKAEKLSSRLKEELVSSIRELEELKEKYSSQQNSLREAIEAKESIIKEKKELEITVQDLNTQIIELEKTYAEKKAHEDIDELRFHLHAMMSQMAEKDAKPAASDSHPHTLHQAELNKMESLYNKTKEDVVRLEHELSESHLEVERLESELFTETKFKDSLLLKKKKLEEDVTEKCAVIAKLEKQLSNYKASGGGEVDHTECQKALKQSEAACGKLKLKLAAIKQQLSDYQDTCMRQEEEVLKVTQSRDAVILDKEKLEISNESLCNSMKEKLKKKEAQLQDTESELQEMKLNYNVLEADRNKLQEAFTQFKLQSETESKKLKERAETSNRVMSVLEEKFEKCQQDLQTLHDESEKALSQIKKELDKSKSKCREHEQTCKELREAEEKLRDDRKKLQQEFNDFRSEAEAKSKKLTERVEAANRNMLVLKEKHEKCEKDLQTLQDDSEKKLSEINKELDKSNSKCREYELACEELREEKEKLEKANRDDHNKLQQELAHFKSEAETESRKLKELAETSNRNMSVLEDKYEKLQKDLQILRSDSEKELSKAKKELDKSKSECREREVSYEKLKVYKEKLEHDNANLVERTKELQLKTQKLEDDIARVKSVPVVSSSEKRDSVCQSDYDSQSVEDLCERLRKELNESVKKLQLIEEICERLKRELNETKEQLKEMGKKDTSENILSIGSRKLLEESTNFWKEQVTSTQKDISEKSDSLQSHEDRDMHKKYVENELRQVKEKLMKKEAEYNKCKKQLTDLTFENQALKKVVEEMDSLRKVQDDALLRGKLQKLRNVESLSAEIKEITRQNSLLILEKSELERKLRAATALKGDKQLVKDAREMKDECKAMGREFRNFKQHVADEADHLNFRLKEMERQNLDLKKKNADLMSELEISSLLQEKTQKAVKARVQELGTVLQSDEIAVVQEQKIALLRENLSLQKTVEELSERMKQLRGENMKVKDENMKVKDENMKLKDECCQKESSLISKETLCKKLETSLQECENKLEDLIAKNKKYEASKTFFMAKEPEKVPTLEEKPIKSKECKCEQYVQELTLLKQETDSLKSKIKSLEAVTSTQVNEIENIVKHMFNTKALLQQKREYYGIQKKNEISLHPKEFAVSESQEKEATQAESESVGILPVQPEIERLRKIIENKDHTLSQLQEQFRILKLNARDYKDCLRKFQSERESVGKLLSKYTIYRKEISLLEKKNQQLKVEKFFLKKNVSEQMTQIRNLQELLTDVEQKGQGTKEESKLIKPAEKTIKVPETDESLHIGGEEDDSGFGETLAESLETSVDEVKKEGEDRRTSDTSSQMIMSNQLSESALEAIPAAKIMDLIKSLKRKISRVVQDSQNSLGSDYRAKVDSADMSGSKSDENGKKNGISWRSAARKVQVKKRNLLSLLLQDSKEVLRLIKILEESSAATISDLRLSLQISESQKPAKHSVTNSEIGEISNFIEIFEKEALLLVSTLNDISEFREHFDVTLMSHEDAIIRVLRLVKNLGRRASLAVRGLWHLYQPKLYSDFKLDDKVYQPSEVIRKRIGLAYQKIKKGPKSSVEELTSHILQLLEQLSRRTYAAVCGIKWHSSVSDYSDSDTAYDDDVAAKNTKYHRKSTSTKEMDKSHEKTAGVSEEIGKLKKDCASKDDIISNLQAEMKNLKEKLSSDQQEVQSQRAMAEDMEIKVDHAEALADKLEKDCETKDKMIADLECEVNRLNEELSNMKGKYQSNIGKRTSSEELRRKIETAEALVDKLKEECETKNEMIENLQKEVNDLKEELSATKGKRQQSVGSSESEADELRRKAESAEALLEKSKDDCEAKDRMIENLQKELNGLKEELSDVREKYQQSIDSSGTMTEELKKQAESAGVSVEKAKKDCEAKDKMIENLQKELNGLKEELSNMNEKYQRDIESNGSTVEEMRKKTESADMLVNKLIKDCETKDKMIQTLQKEISQLEDKLFNMRQTVLEKESLNKSVGENVKVLQQNCAAFESEISSKSKAITDLQGELRQKCEELSKVKSQLQHTLQDTETRRRESKETLALLRQLESDVNEKEHLLKEKDQMLSAKNDKISYLQDELRLKMNEICALGKDLQHASRANDIYYKELMDKSKVVDSLESDLKGRITALNHKEEELSEKVIECALLQEQLDKFQREVCRMKNKSKNGYVKSTQTEMTRTCSGDLMSMLKKNIRRIRSSIEDQMTKLVSEEELMTIACGLSQTGEMDSEASLAHLGSSNDYDIDRLLKPIKNYIKLLIHLLAKYKILADQRSLENDKLQRESEEAFAALNETILERDECRDEMMKSQREFEQLKQVIRKYELEKRRKKLTESFSGTPRLKIYFPERSERNSLYEYEDRRYASGEPPAVQVVGALDNYESMVKEIIYCIKGLDKVLCEPGWDSVYECKKIAVRQRTVDDLRSIWKHLTRVQRLANNFCYAPVSETENSIPDVLEEAENTNEGLKKFLTIIDRQEKVMKGKRDELRRFGGDEELMSQHSPRAVYKSRRDWH